MTPEHEETNRAQPLVPASERVRPQVIFGSISEIEYNEEGHRCCDEPVVKRAGDAMFPSVNELRTKFAEAKYILEEDTIWQVYLAGVMQKPILIEGPPGCGKTELAKAVTFVLDSKLERLQCYPGINEEKAIGRFDTALQKLSSTPNQRARGTGRTGIYLIGPIQRTA